MPSTKIKVEVSLEDGTEALKVALVMKRFPNKSLFIDVFNIIAKFSKFSYSHFETIKYFISLQKFQQ